MSQPADARAEYERLHERLDDANLDTIAKIAGCVPSIGRLNYMDDATLVELVDRMSIGDGARVLDLGCGRGFLGRWLSARGLRTAYSAVDFSRAALDAVSAHLGQVDVLQADVGSVRGGPYDAIFAIESVRVVDASLAASLRAIAAPSAHVAVVISSLNSSHTERLCTTVESLRGAGFNLEPVGFAAGHFEVVGRLCAALLIEPPSDAWVRERMTAEALQTLAALRDGAFQSDLVVARVPT